MVNLCDGRFGGCFCLSLRLDPQQASHPKFFNCKRFVILVKDMFRLVGIDLGDDGVRRVSRLESHVLRDVGLDGELRSQGSVTRKVTLVEDCSW